MCGPDPSAERFECGGRCWSIRGSIDGQVAERIIESSGSGHLERSRRKCYAGRRLAANEMPRAHGATVVYRVQEDCAGVATRTRYSVEWNGAARLGQIDGNGLVQNI